MTNTTPENLILLCGELLTDGKLAYEKDGVEYYEYPMKIILSSGTDVLPVLIAKPQIDDTVTKGAVLSVTGRLLSFAVTEGEETRQTLKVQVGEVYAGETEITSGIFLTGTVLQKPNAYTLETGERAEFHLSVASEQGDAVRIPVACSGECVSVAKGLRAGDRISVLGQLHSYEYLDLNGDSPDSYTAYEVEILTFTNVSFL